MSELIFCRICLDNNVRMHQISGSEVQDVYEKLTNKKVHGSESPHFACYICYYQLKKCQQLVIKSQKAEELLQQVLVNTIELNPKSIVFIDRQAFGLINTISVAAMESYSLNVNDVETDIEIKWENKTEIKIEHNDKGVSGSKPEPGYYSDGVRDSDGPGFDSEDDLPLKSISVRQTRDRKVKVKNKKKRMDEIFVVDASEVFLSKEQQLEALLERSKSLNYISSNYKCDMCYKGFLEATAFENHKIKHDVRSGQHECDICRMRYKSARLLRTHASAAHERLYRCNKCAHITHTANQAREHEKWHNGYTYECQLCGHKFRKVTSYLTHKRKRHPTEHVCHICGESFVGRHGLLMHKSKSHQWDQQSPSEEDSKTDRFCVECDTQFLTVKAWRRHMMTSIKHTLGDDHSHCKICYQKISGDMSIHMKEHAKTHTQKPSLVVKKLAKLACDQCDALFVGRSNLRAHVRQVHLGLKYNNNVVCEVCGKKCTSNATLKYHQRTHTGERPFPCTECGKKFPDSNQLRIHNRIHTGERPYACNTCGKRFSQKPALNRHYRVHTGVKPYECQFCSKAFNQSNSMKLHVNTVHLKLPQNRKKGPSEPSGKKQVIGYVITNNVDNTLSVID